MKVISESEVAQLCPTLSDRMDFSLPGSSIHGIFQARVLECVAIVFSGRIMLMMTFSPVVSPLPGGALKLVCKADMSFIYGVIDSRSDSPSPSRQRKLWSWSLSPHAVPRLPYSTSVQKGEETLQSDLRLAKDPGVMMFMFILEGALFIGKY